MRVTALGSSASMLASINTAAGRVQSAAQDLATGRRIRTASDSPTDTATVLRYNAASAAIASWQRSSSDAQVWLDTTDTTLQSVSSAVIEARGTVLSSLNGALDATAREALAAQLDGLGQHLLTLGNTKVQGRSLFGGFSDTPFTTTAGTVAFTGDAGVVNRQLSATQVVQVNTSGADAFGFTAGDDLFTIVKEAAAAIRAGDTATTQAAVARIDRAHGLVLGELEKVGVRGNEVADSISARQAQDLTLTKARGDLVDTDFAKATLDSQLAKTAYQAALAATAQANLPSLADYLR